MTDLNRLHDALRKADAAGDTQAAKRLADHIRSITAAPKEKAGITRSIADSIVELGTSVLGLPGDISKAISGKEPAFLPTSDDIDEALASMTVPGFNGTVHSGVGTPAGMDERTRFGEIAKTGADVTTMAAAGASIPLAFTKGAMTTGPQATSTVGRIAQDVVQSTARDPRYAQMVETASGLGAGAGAMAAEVMDPGDATTQMLGATAGALAPTTFVPLVAKSANVAINKVFSIFSKAGQEARAADIARHMVESQGGNVDDVYRALMSAEDVGESAALKSGDDGLLRLESWIRQMDADVDKALGEMNKNAVEEMSGLIERLARTGDPQALKMAAAMRAGAYDDAVKRTLNAAQKKAAGASAPLRGGKDAETAGEDAADLLSTAFKKLKAEESIKWSKVPAEADAVAVNTGRAWKEMQAEVPKEILDDTLKPGVRKLLSRYRQKPHLKAKDLQTLRSVLLENARSARTGATPNFAAARMYNQLADAVMDDMAGLPGYDEARAFTASIKRGYDQTFAGRSTRTTGSGERVISDRELLTRGFGGPTGGGPTANRRFGELESAAAMAGDDLAKSMRAEQERFLVGLSERFVKSDGTIKEGATEFLRKNKKLLQRFPELRDTLENSQARTEILRRVKSQAVLRNKMLQRSAISEVMKAEDPARAIGSVITGKNPQRGFKELANTAKKAGPDAVEGLRTAALENVISRSSTFDMLQQNADDVIKMMTQNGVMKSGDASRFRDLLRRASTIEQNIAKASSRAGDIGDGPEGAELLDTMIRIQGAKFGAMLAGKTTGAQLVAAGKGSLMFRKILAKNPFNKTIKILEHAAQNPKIMADLLKKHRTPKLQEQVLLRIRASLVAAGLAPADLEVEAEDQ